MENKNEKEIKVLFRKMKIIEVGNVQEKVWESTLAEFREHYPEYVDELIQKNRCGDAIGENLYFQANISFYHGS